MRKFKLFALILVIGMIAVSCEKEGPAGPAGPAGAAGTNGNANVTLYRFGTQVFNAGNAYWIDITPGLTKPAFNVSVLISYYFDPTGGSWYPIGQIGANSGYTVRQYFYHPTDTTIWSINLKNPDGSLYTGADVTWDSLKLYVIPANVFRSAIDRNVNFNNYIEVSNYYNMK